MTFPYADEIAEFNRGVKRAREAYHGWHRCPICSGEHTATSDVCRRCTWAQREAKRSDDDAQT